MPRAEPEQPFRSEARQRRRAFHHRRTRWAGLNCDRGRSVVIERRHARGHIIYIDISDSGPDIILGERRIDDGRYELVL